MLGVHARSVAIGWFVVVISIGSLEAGQTVSGPYEATINRALGLLPRLPAKVLVVDAAEAARAADAHGRRVEAFVRHGERRRGTRSPRERRCEVHRRGEGFLTTR